MRTQYRRVLSQLWLPERCSISSPRIPRCVSIVFRNRSTKALLLESKATYWVLLQYHFGWMRGFVLRHGYVANPLTTGSCWCFMNFTHKPVKEFWNPILPIEVLSTLILSVIFFVLTTDVRKLLHSHGSSGQVAAYAPCTLHARNMLQHLPNRWPNVGHYLNMSYIDGICVW